MKIVIIGDGKVGYKLAKQLSEDNYDVVLIDNNAGKLKAATNKLDIICITGDGVSAEVQREADVPHADLVIACASTDELNMLSCLIARRLGARHTIARVRNPSYYQQIDILKEDLRLSMAVIKLPMIRRLLNSIKWILILNWDVNYNVPMVRISIFPLVLRWIISLVLKAISKTSLIAMVH